MFYSRNGYGFYCLSGDEAGAGDLGEGWHIPEHQDPHHPPDGQHGGREQKMEWKMEKRNRMETS